MTIRTSLGPCGVLFVRCGGNSAARKKNQRGIRSENAMKYTAYSFLSIALRIV